MKKSLAVRAFSATAMTAAASVVLASEGGPEGLGEMSGLKPLLIIVGGVVIMALVIWLGLKLMNRQK